MSIIANDPFSVHPFEPGPVSRRMRSQRLPLTASRIFKWCPALRRLEVITAQAACKCQNNADRYALFAKAITRLTELAGPDADGRIELRSTEAFELLRARLIQVIRQAATTPAPTAPVVERLSLSQIVRLEPRIVAILEAARHARQNLPPEGNIWIHYSQLKRMFSQLVGWDAPTTAPSKLRTSESYMTVLSALTDALEV